MFESANLKHKVDKAKYKREAAKLRQALLDAQYDLKQNGKFPVLILIAGVEGAGKSETVNLLNEWMDPRHIQTSGFFDPSDEERERPPLWRFWRALPPKGKIGIFFGAWHTMPILQRVFGEINEGGFAREISEIQRFEKMLCDEGVLLLKYWFHLSRSQQRKSLKQLEGLGTDFKVHSRSKGNSQIVTKKKEHAMQRHEQKAMDISLEGHTAVLSSEPRIRNQIGARERATTVEHPTLARSVGSVCVTTE